MLRNIGLIFLASLFAGALELHADEKPATSELNPARLPTPKVQLTPMPADGSGIYRVCLEGAIGHLSKADVPLVVLLDVRQGVIAKAVALPAHQTETFADADASGLTLTAGTLKGTLKLGLWPIWRRETHSRELNGQPNPNFVAYDLKPVQRAEVTLDVSFKGADGHGTYRAAWEGKPAYLHMTTGQEGKVTTTCTPHVPLPARFEADLHMPAASIDSPLSQLGRGSSPAVWLRLAFGQGKSTGSLAWVCAHFTDGLQLNVAEQAFSLKDGRLTGRLVAAYPKYDTDPFTLEIQGQSIGSQIYGTVTFTRGKVSGTTSWIGTLHDIVAWRMPLQQNTGTWTWQHDRSPDAALQAAAAEESLSPLLLGEPGKTGFGTWRDVVRGKVMLSVIHPPCFDLRETEGAVKYRFKVSGGDPGGKKVDLTFDADKPWRPLTPIWKQMVPGKYQLNVRPLNADGAEIPGPMRHGILSNDEKAEPTVAELPYIAFEKRPSYSGPYSTPPKSLETAALQPTKWNWEAMGYPMNRGQAPGGAFIVVGEGQFGYFAANQIWNNLCVRTLTSDPVERRNSEDALRFIREECEIHQRRSPTKGVFHMYKGYTALTHFPGCAAVDAWLQTGDPRWKEIATELGRGLERIQKDNGAFKCSNPGSAEGPGGFFTRWQAGNNEFGSSELLFLLGRIRRDLPTDEFVKAEEKAYRWMIDRSIRDRYFPLYDHHSMSQGYPVWQSGHSALHFCRYLLEVAPPERRDLKLAEELALWAEDHDAIWSRAAAGPQEGMITPQMRRGDRGNDPSYNTVLAAIVFHELGLATGKKLWSAKAEALATSVANAVDSTTGWLNRDLQPTGVAPYNRGFNETFYYGYSSASGPTLQLMREYANLTKKRQ